MGEREESWGIPAEIEKADERESGFWSSCKEILGQNQEFKVVEFVDGSFMPN